MTIQTFRRTLPILALVLGLACGKSPDKAVIKYLEATKNQEPAVAYELLAKADRDFQPRDAFLKNADGGEIGPMLKGITERITHTVKSVAVSGDKAEVRVETKMPDMKAAMAEVMPEVMGMAFANMGKPGATKEDAQKLMTEKMIKAAAKVALVTEEEVYDAVKEDGEWKVNLHLADKERISKLLADAKKLEKEDRFVEAGDAAQKILAIQPSNKDGKTLVAELQPKIAAAKAAEAYFPMIKLGEPKYSKPAFFGKGSVRVSAKNTGDKSVKQLRVLYTLLDKEGKPVSEESGEYGFTKTGPLKPNFEAEGFHALENIPSSFAGKIAVRVISLVLE